MTPIIILGIAIGSVLIWCSLQGPKGSLKYIAISPALLQYWKERCTSLVIIELRNERKELTSQTLAVAPKQLNGLLRWIPPQTTLVLCGKRELGRCCTDIEVTLLGAGINVVYILDDRAASSPDPTSRDPVMYRRANWRA